MIRTVGPQEVHGEGQQTCPDLIRRESGCGSRRRGHWDSWFRSLTVWSRRTSMPVCISLCPALPFLSGRVLRRICLRDARLMHHAYDQRRWRGAQRQCSAPLLAHYPSVLFSLSARGESRKYGKRWPLIIFSQQNKNPSGFQRFYFKVSFSENDDKVFCFFFA